VMCKTTNISGIST